MEFEETLKRFVNGAGEHRNIPTPGYVEHAIPDSSWSAELEAGSDFKEGSARCSVRVFERYSMVGGNRLSLTLTLFQNGDEPIRLSAIAAGGSQAVFFKVNTLGEDAFLEDVKQLLEEILEG